MKIIKMTAYSWGETITRREYMLVHDDGRVSFIFEDANIEYSVAARDREAYGKAPKVYTHYEPQDTIDYWPEFDSPGLRSFADWVHQGKNGEAHPQAAPFMWRGDDTYMWANGQPDSKDVFSSVRSGPG